MADMAVDVLLRAATDRLTAAGVPSPRADAEQLLAHVLDVSRSGLSAMSSVPPITADRFDELVGRRARRIPLQHLTGVTGFRYLELAVGPGVFVPRPETELVAGAAIDLARRHQRPLVVDLCSGSGAIALSVALEVADARVVAVEADPSALRWLRDNADRRAALGDRPVDVAHATAALAVPHLDDSVDVVVANPPYLRDVDVDSLDPEVRDFDPRTALTAPEDGLAVIREVTATAARLLRPGGWLVVEHGDGQGETAPAILTEHGFTDVEDHPDLLGRPRFATGRRAEEPR
jgi:release factor glutamine methyltransferase